MKRVYSAIGILIILPVFIFLGQIYLKNSTADMTDSLTEAQKYESDNNITKAKDFIKEYQAKWKKNEKIMATFIRHSELDIINQNSAKLDPYLIGNDKSNFNAECEEIKAQLEHLDHSEKFSFDNIF